MTDKSKDVIYIDIDDEITGIIDKVRSSEARILALVLPKRASVFQSIVNMKLLKRTADADKKRLVLITSEAGLLPLAGAVGLHVAKSLQSKPEIPAGPVVDDGEETVDEEPISTDAPISAETAGDTPIGQLAGPSALTSTPLTTDEALETVELDNDEEVPGNTPPSAAPLPLAAKPNKDKKLKVPNFNRFRLLLVLGVLILILLGIGLYVAASVLPKATIMIKTDATNVNTNLNLTLDTAAQQPDLATNTIPAKQVQQQKTYTQQAPATGQQNQGNKASGSVSITAEQCGSNPFQVPSTVPAGTGVSSNGLTFITQQDTTFSLYGAQPAGNNCYDYPAANATPVLAQNGGTQYNIGSGSKFTIAGFSGYSGKNGSDFSGGTDNIVKVVTQSDIDGAKAKISTADPTVKQALQSQLQQAGYYPVTATFSAGTPNTTTSANVGDAADTVTVTETVTYTMLGAQQSDLKTLLANQINSQIDTSKQSILSDGLSSANISVNNTSGTTTQLNVQTSAEVGSALDVTEIKNSAAGKKIGDVQTAIKSDPGVTDVTVKLSPFWVTTVPKNTSKITVTIAKPTNTVNANNP